MVYFAMTEKFVARAVFGSLLTCALSVACPGARAESCFPEAALLGAAPEDVFNRYIDVAFGGVVCNAPGLKGSDCEPRIERREADYFAAMAGVGSLSPDTLQAVGKQISLTNSEIKMIAGIEGYATPRNDNDSMLALIFVGPNGVEGHSEEYIKNNLELLQFGSSDTMTLLFEKFLAEASEPCLTLNKADQDENIKISATWIKSDFPVADINQCVARAFVGGVGLIADNMFLAPDGREVPNNSSALFKLPAEYRAFLEVHYSDAVKPGLTKEQVESSTALSELRCN